MSSLFVFDIKAPQAYGKLGGLFIGNTIKIYSMQNEINNYITNRMHFGILFAVGCILVLKILSWRKIFILALANLKLNSCSY